MSVAAKPIVPPARVSRVAVFWRNAIGKKAIMAITGIVLFAFVFVHMLGNLQVFSGAEAINRYAELLRVSPQILWTARVVLLGAVIIHIVAGVQLHLAARTARPVGYADYRPTASSAASRTMIWSGLLILGFVIYHLLDLTIGVANPDFREGDVYHNMLASFGQVTGVAAYLVAMVGLGFHLWHGLWSMFQSLGMANRRLTAGAQRFAVAMAVILTVGFAAVPIAVLVGLIR